MNGHLTGGLCAACGRAGSPRGGSHALQGRVRSGRVLCPFARCSLKTNGRYTPQLSARRLKRHSLHDEGDLRLPAGEYTTAKLACTLLSFHARCCHFCTQQCCSWRSVQLRHRPCPLGLPSHVQAVLGGNSSPSKDDITSILGSGACVVQIARSGWYETLFRRCPSVGRSSGCAIGAHVVAAYCWAL